MIATAIPSPVSALILVAFAVQTAAIAFCVASFLLSGMTPDERKIMRSNGVWIGITGYAILAGYIAANI